MGQHIVLLKEHISMKVCNMESRHNKMMQYANMDIISKVDIADIVIDLEKKDIPYKKEILTLLAQLWMIRVR